MACVILFTPYSKKERNKCYFFKFYRPAGCASALGPY